MIVKNQWQATALEIAQEQAYANKEYRIYQCNNRFIEQNTEADDRFEVPLFIV